MNGYSLYLNVGVGAGHVALDGTILSGVFEYFDIPYGYVDTVGDFKKWGVSVKLSFRGAIS